MVENVDFKIEISNGCKEKRTYFFMFSPSYHIEHPLFDKFLSKLCNFIQHRNTELLGKIVTVKLKLIDLNLNGNTWH